MSTDNLEFGDLEKLLGQLGTAVPARAKKIDEELDGQSKHRGKIAIGASAIVQRSLDTSAKLEEEKQQMVTIVQRAQRMLDEIDDNDAAPVAPVQPVAAPAPEPVVAPAPVAPVAPAPQPTLVQPVAAPAPSAYHPSNWEGLAWALAIILGIIGLIIGVETRSFADALPDVVEQLVKTMWIVGLTLFGAGIGGLIGTFFTLRRNAQG